MVGNPYPSSIIWDDDTDLPGGWDMTNIDPVVWVWDVASGAWKFYDASDNSGDLDGGKISTGQAFWVYATGASPSLTVHEAAKTGVSGAYYRKRETTSPTLIVTVKGDGTLKDNAYLTLGESSSNVSKFRRGVEAISVAILPEEGDRLARFVVGGDQGDIPISVVFKNEGEYEFSFGTKGDTPEAWAGYYLVDRYLNKISSIQESYSFSVTKSAQTFENRFYLSANPNQFASESDGDKVIINAYPNPTDGYLNVEINSPVVQSISLINNYGQVIKNNQVTIIDGVGYTGLDLTALPKGLYYVRVVNADQKVYIKKVLKQ